MKHFFKNIYLDVGEKKKGKFLGKEVITFHSIKIFKKTEVYYHSWCE